MQRIAAYQVKLNEYIKEYVTGDPSSPMGIFQIEVNTIEILDLLVHSFIHSFNLFVFFFKFYF